MSFTITFTAGDTEFKLLPFAVFPTFQQHDGNDSHTNMGITAIEPCQLDMNVAQAHMLNREFTGFLVRWCFLSKPKFITMLQNNVGFN